MRVKLLREKKDQKNQEAALCDTVKEWEQQYSDLTVIYNVVSHSIMHASLSSRIHFEGNFAVGLVSLQLSVSR